jgi:alkane 1-monooxygenase
MIIPMIDQVLGVDTSNTPPPIAKVKAEEYYYRFVLYCWVYVQFAFLFWGFYAVTTGKLETVVEWVGFVLSFALTTGGIGITVAHELGHKKSNVERFYSKAQCLTLFYQYRMSNNV